MNVKEWIKNHKTEIALTGGLLIGSAITIVLLRNRIPSNSKMIVVTDEIATAIKNSDLKFDKSTHILQAPIDAFEHIIADSKGLIDLQNVGGIVFDNVK